MQEKLVILERELFHEFIEFYFACDHSTRDYLHRRLETIELLHLLDKQLYSVPRHMLETFEVNYQPSVVKPGRRIAEALSDHGETILSIPHRTIRDTTLCFDPYGRLAKFDFRHRIIRGIAPDVDQVHRCVWLLRRMAELKRALALGYMMATIYGTPKSKPSRSCISRCKRQRSSLMKSKGHGTLLRICTTVADLELEDEGGMEWETASRTSKRHDLYSDDEVSNAKRNRGCILKRRRLDRDTELGDAPWVKW